MKDCQIMSLTLGLEIKEIGIELEARKLPGLFSQAGIRPRHKYMTLAHRLW